MVWIFALGIVTLAVFHKGFRKVALWLAGIAVGIVLLVTLNMAVTGRW